jgi:hypothetical protein
MRAPPEAETIMIGYFFARGQFHRSGHLLAHHRAHRSADEFEFHRTTNYRAAVQFSFRGEYRVVHAQFLASVMDALLVGLGVSEAERVGGNQLGVVLQPIALIQQQLQPALRAHPEVEVTFRADVPVRIQIFFPDNRAAGLALGP